MTGSPIYSYDKNRHAGTVTGATWGYQGRTFDGTDDRINCGDKAVFNLTDAITLMAWINVTTDVGYAGVIAKGTAGGYYLLDLDAGGDYARANWVGVSGAHPVVDNTVELINGTWYLIGWSYDRQNSRLWVNGVNVQTDPQTEAILSATGGSLLIGEDFSGAADFNGIIGDCWLYNRVLTLAEIQHIYNATKWRYV